MLATPTCSVCDQLDWQFLRSVQIHRDAKLPLDLPNRDYVMERMRVVFEVWFPDEDSVSWQEQKCRHCGFVTFTPRPSADDLTNKYLFLSRIQTAALGGQTDSQQARLADARRSRRIYDLMRRFAGAPLKRVLDHGGGTGKLMAKFVENGCECDLIDYSTTCVRGVNRVAQTLEETPAKPAYDAIVCSHVLEHVADPSELVGQLLARLQPQGLLYAEVPMELTPDWTIRWDAVTHVNFFNALNFQILFQQAGAHILFAREEVGTYNGGRLDVAYILAQSIGKHAANNIDAGRFLEAAQRTDDLLARNSLRELVRRWRLRQFPTWQGLVRRMNARLQRRKRESCGK